MKHLESGVGDASRRGPGIWISGAAAAACLGLIVWIGLGWDAIRASANYQGKKGDYYSSLVNGFLSGHLYMDKKADPGLESPDPAVRAGAPKLLDAGYYRGHFYLYYGATPAVLVLLPYAWLTGSDLEPRHVVVLGVCLGFLFSVGIWRMVARDFFPRVGAVVQAAAILTLAFSTAAPLLLARAMFYELPAAWGYACTMASFLWIYRALSGRGSTSRQLALASLALGLAVGCRADLVLCVPILAAAAFQAARRRGAAGAPAPAFLRYCSAALLPAAAVGVLLALYNFERFGSPFDFGFRHGQNDFFGSRDPLTSAAFIWPNFHWYYLTFPSFSPFFPFVYPEAASFRPAGYHGHEAVQGQFPVFCLVAFTLVSSLLLRRQARMGRLSCYLSLLGWAFFAPFAAMAILGIRADRYMLDFQPELVLGSVLLAGMAASALGGGPGAKVWRALFAALALWAASFNVFAALQEFDAFKNIRNATYRTLESLGNYPSYWLEETGVLPAGPVELTVVFPTNLKTTSYEPLLTAGTPDNTDSLYAMEWAGGRQIELMGDHRGYGGPTSGVIAITPGQAYTLRIDMGALYPPLRHPFFSPYRTMQARLLKTGIRVEMDGKTVLDEKMDSYDAPPWSLESGRNDVSLTPFKTRFAGRILSARRLAPPAPTMMGNNGLWRIRCVFPLQRPDGSFPLLSAGMAGSGTLVFLNVLPENRIRFGLDEWSVGGSFSDAFESTPRSEHAVEIFIGPLAKMASWPKKWAIRPEQLGRFEHILRIWLDGRLVWTTQLHLPFDPLDSRVDVGANLQGFSTTPPDYPGPIRYAPYSAGEAREFLGRNLGEKP